MAMDASLGTKSWPSAAFSSRASSYMYASGLPAEATGSTPVAVITARIIDPQPGAMPSSRGIVRSRLVTKYVAPASTANAASAIICQVISGYQP